MLEFGNIRIDFERRLLFNGDATVVLAPKVFDLLAHLIRNYGRVVTREELSEHVWDGSALASANIAQHVLLLRRAIGDVRKPHKFVRSVHGEGYVFVREPRPVQAFSPHAAVSLTPLQLLANARYLCEQRTPAAIQAALHLYETAIRKDPSDARFHAGKALAHFRMAAYLYGVPAQELRYARESATKAVSLDPLNVDAFVVGASLALTQDYDAEACLRTVARLHELRPDLETLYILRAQAFVVLRRFDEALLAAEEGIAWHPGSIAMNTLVGYALYAAGRYAESAAHLHIVLDLAPDASQAAYYYAMSRFMMGDRAGAVDPLRALLAQSKRQHRGQPVALQHVAAALIFILRASGNTGEASAVLERLGAYSHAGIVTASHRAIALAGADEQIVADELNKAVKESDPWVVFAPVSHFFDMYEHSPWYRELLHNLTAPRSRCI